MGSATQTGDQEARTESTCKPFMKIPESGYQIRAARVEEIPLLSETEQSAASLFLDTSYAFLVSDAPLPLDFVQQQLQAGRVWVAVNCREQSKNHQHETVVGYAIELLEVECIIYLQQLDVAPKHGRRGIGSALVNTVCTWAKAQGYRIISLSTFRGISWNAPFYSKLGFCSVDEAELTTGFQQIRLKEVAAGLPIFDRAIMQRVL